MPVPKRLLLDTDIVIHLLKKRSDILEFFIEMDEQDTQFYLYIHIHFGTIKSL